MLRRGAASVRSTQKKRQTIQPSPLGPFSIKETGVDWITATCRDVDLQDRFKQLGYALLQTQAELGEQVKPWSFEGFHGLNGHHVAFGEQPEMCIMRLSSGVAWSYWRKCYELATNVSRIDFQVTVEGVPDCRKVILTQHRNALKHVEGWTKPPEVDLRLSNRRGPTLYLGVRQSDYFGRVYDKGRESKLDHYAGCVRTELQCNGRAARRAAHEIYHRGLSPSECEPYVAEFFRRRGCSRLWREAAGLTFCSPRSRTTNLRRLLWIRNQVAPAVQSLIDSGLLPEVLDALGLSKVAGESGVVQQSVHGERNAGVWPSTE
jgi:hypothetical protein